MDGRIDNDNLYSSSILNQTSIIIMVIFPVLTIYPGILPDAPSDAFKQKKGKGKVLNEKSSIQKKGAGKAKSSFSSPSGKRKTGGPGNGGSKKKFKSKN